MLSKFFLQYNIANLRFKKHTDIIQRFELRFIEYSEINQAFINNKFLSPAQRFALMETKLAIAKLVLNFQMMLAPGYEEVKIMKKPGVLRPQDGILNIVLKKL